MCAALSSDRSLPASYFGQLCLQAQDFSLLGREVEIHGFVSQGFVYTNTNNWLTMNSSQGSMAFTDFGINLSTQVTPKLRVGAQLYDRNLGQLGQYHPSLDWAVADYRFRNWFGIRGGKVKTALGLYTDSQDLDFLHVFALLPQSVYPTDIRDATIAHSGGDIYGNVSLRRHTAISLIRRMPAVAVTAFIAVIPIFFHSMESISKATLACNTAPICVGILRSKVC